MAVGTPELSLLRPGAPLVEALHLQQDWDERAQTAAVWQAATDLPADVVGIRCDFVIRADPSAAFATWAELEAHRPRETTATRTDADAPLAVAALQRRVDAYLPPVTQTLWFGADGEALEEPGLVARLEAVLHAADPASAWETPRWADLERRLGLVSLADLMVRVAGRAPIAALEASGAAERASSSAERAAAEWDDVERLLALRAELSLDGQSAQRDLDAERRVARALVAAISAPAAAWSGACLVVLSAAESP